MAHRPRGPDEQLIGALIPTPMHQPQPVPPPLPTLPAQRQSLTGSLHFDTAHVDPSVRICIRPLLLALSWSLGQPLTIDVVDRIVIVTTSHVHGHAVGARGTLTLSAAVRQIAGIDCGTTVIAAANLATQTLFVHPEAVVARLLSDLHAHVEGGCHGH